MHRARIFFFGVVVFAGFLFVQNVHAAGTDDLRGWTWSERVGWTSLNCINLDSCPPGGINYGVDFSPAGAVTGWAWSERVGWICFGSSCGGLAPDGLPTEASVSLVSGQMRGWGKIWNLGEKGWISLSCVDLGTCGIVDYRVTVNFLTGSVTGWSWNGNDDGTGVGWMDWSYANILLSETVCDNGLDDDNDGNADCADQDCDGLQGGTVLGSPVFCQYGNESGPNCTDLFNNDSDLYTDCQDTTSCWHNPAFGCPAIETSCSDGIDNDEDDGSGNWDASSLSGRDCADYDCAGDPACPGSETICTDGIDNDLDGKIDCADSPDCDDACSSYCSEDPARKCLDDDDCAGGDPPGGICVVQPWLQTKFHNLYTRESISAANPPPGMQYNATYCLLTGTGVVSNFLSDPNFGCAMPPAVELFNFPKVANRYATSLGRIDIKGILNGNYGAVIDITGTSLNGSTSLGGRVLYSNGNLNVDPSGAEFRAGVGSESGAGTIVVLGDLNISGPLTYRPELAGRIKNLASVGFIVLKRADGSGGNIVINGSVKKVVGAFYAEKTFNTGASANDLSISGLVVAREFIWSRTFADKTKGSEQVIYDGRATANPPPGFADVVKSLPVIKQGIIQ